MGQKFDGAPLFYLSFAGDDGFRGCCFIEGAVEVVTAVKLAHAYGCNPGGQVMGMLVDGPDVPEGFLDRARAVKHRLLTAAELEEVSGEPVKTLREWEEEEAGKMP